MVRGLLDHGAGDDLVDEVEVVVGAPNCVSNRMHHYPCAVEITGRTQPSHN